MSNYRVKHFWGTRLKNIEDEVNNFIKENAIEVLKYTFMALASPREYTFIGTLEYEELDHED